MSADQRDFLDEIVAERSVRTPEFPDLVQAALDRRLARPEPGTTATGSAADPPRVGEIGD